MSLRINDGQGRWRNKTVAFLVSPEEWEQVNMMAYTSGLQKQDFLIKRALQQDIITQPSPRMQKALRVHLERVAEELKRHERISSDDDLLGDIRYLLALIKDLCHE